jgi:replicative DNA helicase
MNGIMAETKSKSHTAKMPPYSKEAEQSLLGALLLDNAAYEIIAQQLKPDAFYFKHHQLIFKNIVEMINKSRNVDVLTLTEFLKNKSILDQIEGGDNYLFSLANQTGSTANIAEYAHVVKEQAAKRHIIEMGQQLIQLGYNPEGRESREMIDELEKKLFVFTEEKHRKNGPESINDILTVTSEKIDTMYQSKDSFTGVSTGFADLDKLTSGLQKSDLIVIAGRPSMGKTVLGVNILEHIVLKERRPALLFSLEMPSDSIVMRMLSSVGRINQHRVRTGKLKDDDWQRLTHAIGQLSETELYIDDTPSLTPQDIRTRARRVAKKHNGSLGVIVIDYLQLMTVPGHRENRSVEISEISRQLKALAKELETPVIAISQLNRSLEQRHDKRPIMSDLRESGAIEQDADIIGFIYRDEVYNKQSAQKGLAEVIIAKHRNGPIANLNLTFIGEYTRFENYTNEGYIVAE